MEKPCRKYTRKTSPSFFILVNLPKQPLRARNYFKNKIFWKAIIKNLLKSQVFFFLNPVPLNGQSYQKQKGDQLLFRSWNKFTIISLLVIYYLTKFDDVIQSSFWVIPKIASANLCKPIHDINYCTSIFPFESGKCGKKEENLQKFEYLKNEKSFLDEKTFFAVFEGPSFGEIIIQ